MRTILFLVSLTLLVGCNTTNNSGIKPIPATKTELSKGEELKMLEEFAAHHTLLHRFAVQEGREASEYYGVFGIPQVVLVDQQGKVRMIKVGSGEQNARDVEDSIRGLLKLSPLEELPPVKKPLPAKPAAAADPKKTLKDNPNDLKAYISYMRSFSARFYSLLKKDPKKAEELVKEEEIFIRSLEKPSDEKANLTYRRLPFLPVKYRTFIKVETTSLPDLKKDLESNLGSASARELYQMKVSGHIPSSLAKDDPDAAEKKVLAEKKFLESLKPKVSGQIEDPEAAKKATEAITSLIDRYLGGIEGRIDSSRRHTELLDGGEMMPLAKIDWVNGKPLTDNDLKGKVVLVDFWAVWCGPCIATFPHLREWHDKYADMGFEIIGYTSYYKRYDWKDGKLIRLQKPKPKLPIKRK